MRKLIALTAVAPFALLAACGDNDAETTTMDDETVAADMDANATADSTMAQDDGVTTATSLDDAGDYSGSYSYSAPDGSTQDLMLNSSDNTYEYTRADGTRASGTYERNADGYRIRVADFYGSPAWFTFSNDRLVRLQQDVEVTADTDFSAEDSGFEDRAVFSRSPELGSPVTPEG
ncbi:MAG: hypothetical protein WBA68_01430 [Alteraurantiacibacter sp.]